MITKFGKRFLTNYLAGNISFSEKELAFGIGSTAANSSGNDTRLEFEFYRVPVKLTSIDIAEVSGSFVYKAVFVATIPQDVAGVISEIALYPASRTNDSLSIAYKKIDANLSKIRVKLYSSETQYCYVDFTPASGTGDRIQSASLNTLFSNTSTTPPDFKNITNLGVEVTATSGGTTSFYFDGIRINDEDTFDPSYGMISRSVLTGGDIITKPSGRQVDVEYKLQLGF